MRRAQAALAGLGRFVWDLLVGDDWRIAAAIAVVLVLGAFATATSVVPGAVLAPVLAAALVAVTLTTLLIGKQACAVSNDGKRTFTSSGVFSGGSLGYPKVAIPRYWSPPITDARKVAPCRRTFSNNENGAFCAQERVDGIFDPLSHGHRASQKAAGPYVLYEHCEQWPFGMDLRSGSS